MKTITLLGLGILVIAFQNFTYVDWSSIQLTPINERLRAKHAKELLGGKALRERSAKAKRGITSFTKPSKKEIKSNQRLHQLIKANLLKEDLDSTAEIASTMIRESQKSKLDPFFVMAVIKTESGFDPRVVGSHGEIGLMQIKPDTAEWIVEKYDIDVPQVFDLKDPIINIRIGIAYFKYLRESFPKDPMSYIGAYNMGPNNVRKLASRKQNPKEYPTRVLENYIHIYDDLDERS